MFYSVENSDYTLKLTSGAMFDKKGSGRELPFIQSVCTAGGNRWNFRNIAGVAGAILQADQNFLDGGSTSRHVQSSKIHGDTARERNDHEAGLDPVLPELITKQSWVTFYI